MYNFELFQVEFFNPLRRNVQFFHPPQAGLQKNFDPPHLSTTPYSWVKSDQPLKHYQTQFNLESTIMRNVDICENTFQAISARLPIKIKSVNLWSKVSITHCLITVIGYS